MLAPPNITGRQTDFTPLEEELTTELALGGISDTGHHSNLMTKHLVKKLVKL